MASGCLGLDHVPAHGGRVTREAIDERYPALLPALRDHPGIGFFSCVCRAAVLAGDFVLGPIRATIRSRRSARGPRGMSRARRKFPPLPGHPPQQRLLARDRRGRGVRGAGGSHGGLGGLAVAPVRARARGLATAGRGDRRRRAPARHAARLAGGSRAHVVCATAGDARRRARAVSAVTWLGHATVLIELDGTRLLTDPCCARASAIWSARASRRRSRTASTLCWCHTCTTTTPTAGPCGCCPASTSSARRASRGSSRAHARSSPGTR